MMPRVDINCDMGESFGVYTLGCDREMIKHISSANIACGFHAGDPMVMKTTVQLALKEGVGIGAHPGFFDLLGFGRRPIQVEPDRLKQEIIYQLGALQSIAKSQGGSLAHVKPHGSLNNLAAVDYELALLIAEAVALVHEDLIFVAQYGSCLCDAGEEMGLKVAREAFADRAYQKDGQLVSRQREGALLTDVDTIVRRVLNMVEREEIETIEGDMIPMKAQTICVHGDTPAAVEMAARVSKALISKGVEVTPLASLFS